MLIRTAGYEGFSTAQDLISYLSTTRISGAAISTSAARTGAQGLRVTTTGSGFNQYAAMPAFVQSGTEKKTNTTMIAGLAFRVSALPTGSNKMHLLQLIDTLTYNNVAVSVFLNSSGELRFTVGGTTTQASDTGYAGPTIQTGT